MRLRVAQSGERGSGEELSDWGAGDHFDLWMVGGQADLGVLHGVSAQQTAGAVAGAVRLGSLAEQTGGPECMDSKQSAAKDDVDANPLGLGHGVEGSDAFQLHVDWTACGDGA